MILKKKKKKKLKFCSKIFLAPDILIPYPIAAEALKTYMSVLGEKLASTCVVLCPKQLLEHRKHPQSMPQNFGFFFVIFGPKFSKFLGSLKTHI